MLGGCAEWRERFETTFEANTHVRYSRSSTWLCDFCVAASNAALCALLTVTVAGVRAQSRWTVWSVRL